MGNAIQKSVSTFVEGQFPQFYLEEGPVFVSFLKEYFRWLESKTPVVSKKIKKQRVSVSTSNNVLIGYGTSFDTEFSEGGRIAVYRDANYYDIHTIDSIANSSYMELVDVPSFSNSSTSIAFVSVKANPLHLNRRILEYTDVDETIDDYILHFKNEYLAGVQFETTSSIRQLLKHTLDLYRAKGTPRAMQLLFRIVFGVEIDIYYPGGDLFRLSDGEWFVPRYIEIILSPIAHTLVNRQVYGSSSGATAFVDRVVRRMVRGRLADVLYISAVNGSFSHGEFLNFSSGDALEPGKRPVVLGSLYGVEISADGSGEGFSVGDVIDIESATGESAKGRVSSIGSLNGIVRFNLVNGGFGYEANGDTRVIVSEKIVRVSNLVIDMMTNPFKTTYFDFLEQITQPLGTINYVSGNGVFIPGANLYSYYPNNHVRGEGRVLSSSVTNTSVGSLFISVLSGDFSANQFFTYSNAVGANVSVISGYTDQTSSANVMGVQNTVTIAVNAIIPSVVGSVIVQKDEFGFERASGVVQRISSSSNGSVLTLSTPTGIFVIGEELYADDVSLGEVIDVSIVIGVISISDDFTALSGNFLYGAGNTTATITSLSSGTGANVGVSNNLINVDEIIIDTKTFLFDEEASELFDLSSFELHDFINAESVEIGSISSLTSLTMGTGYTAAPMVLVDNPSITPYEKKDYVLEVTSEDSFSVGEYVGQEATEALGIVRSYSSGVMVLERLRFADEHDFIPTVNASTIISSQNSASVGNVTSVELTTTYPFSGENAMIEASLSASNGACVTVEVQESGWGFITGQEVTMTSNSGAVANGFAVCLSSGRGRGFYRREGGFLSSNKKLHDGRYWQDFSYDIRSPVTLDKYADMVRSITHVAGTKNFANLIHLGSINSSSTFGETEISIS